MNFVKVKLRKDLSLFNFGGAFEFFLKFWLSDGTPPCSTSKGGAFYVKYDEDFLQEVESLYSYKIVEKIISTCFCLSNEPVYKSLDINLYYKVQAFFFECHTVVFDKSDWELN